MGHQFEYANLATHSELKGTKNYPTHPQKKSASHVLSHYFDYVNLATLTEIKGTKNYPTHPQNICITLTESLFLLCYPSHPQWTKGNQKLPNTPPKKFESHVLSHYFDYATLTELKETKNYPTHPPKNLHHVLSHYFDYATLTTLTELKRTKNYPTHPQKNLHHMYWVTILTMLPWTPSLS